MFYSGYNHKYKGVIMTIRILNIELSSRRGTVSETDMLLRFKNEGKVRNSNV